MFRLLGAAGVLTAGVTGPAGPIWSMLHPLSMLRNNSVTFWPHFQCHRYGSGKETVFIFSAYNSIEFGSQLQQNQPETDKQYVNKVGMNLIHFPNLGCGAGGRGGGAEIVGGLSVLDSSDCLNSYFSEEKFSPEC